MRSRPKRESLVQKYAAPTNQRLCALKSDRLLDAVLPTLATKADIGELRGDFKGWTLTTTVTLIIAMLTGFTGMAGYLVFHDKPVPAAQPAQPITLNLSPTPVAPAASASRP